MASPASLPQEVQSSTPQASPPTSASPASVVGSPNDKSSTGNDSIQEATPPKFVTSPGYAVAPPSFSYKVPPNANASSGSSQPLSSSSVANLPGSSTFLKPPAPAIPATSGPSFSFSIPPSGPQFQPRLPILAGPSHGVRNISSSAASLQPPVPGLVVGSRPPDTVGQVMTLSSSIPVPQGASPNASNFSYNGNSQPMQTDETVKPNTAEHVSQGASHITSVPSVSHSIAPPANAALASNLTAPSWTPSAPPVHVSPGGSRPPLTPGIIGMAPVLSSSSTTVQSSSVGSSPAYVGNMMPPTPNQQQIYPPFASNPHPVVPIQGLWMQAPPHISGLPRPPVLTYPASFPGSFPLSNQSLVLSSVRPLDSHPPGVTPVGTPAASVNQPSVVSTMQPELPPGIDNSKHVNNVSGKEESMPVDQLNAWSAHRTDAGVVYYYNALTGESTYQKPAGYKGELEKVTAQPTPVAWEMCAGTDWSLVSTNDGKRYYYNTKTKLSSWQIPAEVMEMRKKDEHALKEQSMSVSSTNTLTEKGSVPLSLSAPAVNSGGRDAIAFRTSGVPGSSSALDLIKKKLQESGGASPTSSSVPAQSESNGSSAVEVAVKGPENENGKDKLKDDGHHSDTSSDSEDVDTGPTKEECAMRFKEMLKERGVAPFSKWEKELPKIVFDPRFKAVPGHSARRALFEHYVRTRAEEERKEKRAAQKAAIERYKQLLEEAKEDIDHNTDYQTFKRKWGDDPRFEAVDRKEREVLLYERVLPLKKSAEEEARAIRAAAVSSFKSMLQEKGDITRSSRWSKVKDTLRDDPRYKSVKHEERETLFNEYISELKAADKEAEGVAKGKWEEEEKLKERERALHKQKEREEKEVERVRSKACRKEAIESYQALLVETIKDPQASWTDSKPRLEKDPQGRAGNPYLDQSDLEKLFREHVKTLHDRCAHEFRTLLAEVITAEAAGQEKDGKTILTSWSTAKHLLKSDPRYTKMPRKDRESLWYRHVEEIQRRQKSGHDHESERHPEPRSRSLSGAKRTHDRR